MNPNDLPEYDDQELESRASHFLASHYGTIVRIPVDVDWLIERLPDVGFDCYPALRANYGVAGGVWRDVKTGQLAVYVDEDVMDDHSANGVNRYRTTVAEELAHILIHRDLIEKVDSPTAFQQLHNKLLNARVERNAKRLAVALLMPREQLWEEASREYAYWVQQQGTDTPGSLKLMICGGLARRFRVSHEAMNKRLDELKLYQEIDDAARRGRPRLV